MLEPEWRSKGTLPLRVVSPLSQLQGVWVCCSRTTSEPFLPVPSAPILPYASPSFTLSLEVALAVDSWVLEEQRYHQVDDPPASPRSRSLSRPGCPWGHSGSTALSDPSWLPFRLLWPRLLGSSLFLSLSLSFCLSPLGACLTPSPCPLFSQAWGCL